MTKKTEENVKYSISTHAAEKLTPSREAIRLCEQISEGRITGDTAVLKIIRSYGIDDRQKNV